MLLLGLPRGLQDSLGVAVRAVDRDDVHARADQLVQAIEVVLPHADGGPHA